MLEVFLFIFKCMGEYLAMLFRIDMGFMSLGSLMCCIFIYFPLVISILLIFKSAVIEVDVTEPLKERLRSKRNENYAPKHAKKEDK